MDGSSHPWFQFRVNETTRHRLYVPERIRDLLESRNGQFFVSTVRNNTPYPVLVRLVAAGPVWRCYIEQGWTNFLDENDIKDGDTVEMYYIGRFCFMARVCGYGMEHLGEGGDMDLDSSEEEACGNGHITDDITNDPPLFVAKITKHYIRAGRLYVPDNIARENLNGYPELTNIQMVMGRNVYDGLLNIKYDETKNIVLCFLKGGVRQMIECNFIQPGQSLTVEFYGDVVPPLFFVTPLIYL